MGTAVGARCLWSDPQIKPALQFRQLLWAQSLWKKDQVSGALVPQLTPPLPQPKNLGLGGFLCHTWGISSVPGPRDTQRTEAQPLP